VTDSDKQKEINIMATISFRLNDKSVAFNGNEERMLLWVLRTDLALTGAKHGCGKGLCGACKVFFNRKISL
jgi:aerobic-type carbon monoxide dehydrogenase small subunit (CoxS/CutS family)